MQQYTNAPTGEEFRITAAKSYDIVINLTNVDNSKL